MYRLTLQYIHTVQMHQDDRLYLMCDAFAFPLYFPTGRPTWFSRTSSLLQ